MKDAIILKDLQAFCRLGIYDSERILGQCIYIQLELEADLSKACQTDDIQHTINYAEVSVAIRTLAQSKDFLLIEHLAEEVSKMLFAKFKLIDGIKIEITKTIVNADQFTGTPAIRVYRQRPQPVSI